jgi:hypothetical protein
MSSEFRRSMKEDKPRYGEPLEGTYGIEYLEFFLQAGQEMGIGVTVLAHAREGYVELLCENNEKRLVMSKVPEGKVRIEVANDIGRMKKFGNRVNFLLGQAKILSEVNCNQN